MRILRVVLTAALLASLGACSSSSSQSDAPVVHGACIISYAMTANDGTAARLGGKTFQVQQERIAWDRGGSLKLPPNWGLLELRESSNAVEISLDGVLLTNVAK
jgi:hypothetical protein